MPLALLNHSALALFAQRTRIPTSAPSAGFCVIWFFISSSSSFEKSLERQLKYFGLVDDGEKSDRLFGMSSQGQDQVRS